MPQERQAKAPIGLMVASSRPPARHLPDLSKDTARPCSPLRATMARGDVAMNDDIKIITEPGFWIAIVLALSPIIAGGVVIWWVQQ